MILQPADSRLGSRVTGAYPGSSGHQAGGTPPWTGHTRAAGPLTPTLTHTGTVQTPIHLLHTAVGGGSTAGSPERTRTDVGRTCTLPSDSGSSWELIFFSHQRYNKTTLNKRRLSEDLLH